MSSTRTAFGTVLVSLLFGCGPASPPAITPADVPGLDALDVPASDTPPADLPTAVDQGVVLDVPVVDVPPVDVVSIDVPLVDTFLPDMPGTEDVSTCTAPMQRCGEACVDLATDPHHCGGCTTDCTTLPSVDPTRVRCVASACDFTTRCQSGRGHCSTSATTGCETDLTIPAHCGSCTAACSEPTPFCSMTASGTYACASGCSALTPTRCDSACVDLASNTNHCGACGNACATRANTATRCTTSTCTYTCTVGFADCDGNTANGCETDLRSSPSSCSTCGRTCAFPNATAGCSDGVCIVADCNVGFANCNGIAVDGCEIDLRTTVANCGTCGRTCRTANATPACRASVCGIDTCTVPFDDCDHAAENGCEVNTSGDLANCGACGSACTARANSSVRCTSGACAYTCTSGFADCDSAVGNGCETDLRTTATNCGTCGHVCSLANATPGCSLGACTIASCDVGFADCNGNAADGCERDVRSAVANCGSCGRVCVAANATPVCSAGTCAFSTCNTGFGSCDGNAANGCETTLSTTTNCGACGAVCPVPSGPHAVRACTLSAGTYRCGAVCDAGWTDCDGNVSNGCEVMGACVVERTLFEDDLERGTGNWTLGTGWGTQFGSDCTGVYDLNSGTSRFPAGSCPTSGSATMLRDVDASRAIALYLSYADWSFNAGSSTGRRFSVDVSADRGATWTPYDATGSNGCATRTLDLSAFAGQATVRVRFTFFQFCGTNTTWDVDDVRLIAAIRQY